MRASSTEALTDEYTIMLCGLWSRFSRVFKVLYGYG